jgi:hypothetical protein
VKGFRAFLLRGNVVDLAVGIVIGAAFTTVVNKLPDRKKQCPECLSQIPQAARKCAYCTSEQAA